MQSYTIKTDADIMTTDAESFDDAARQHDSSVSTADELIQQCRSVGGWCWIERDADGERIGDVTGAE